MPTTQMPTTQMPIAPVAGVPDSVPDDWFELPITILDEDSCAQSDSCDTSDGCSSTCPSACASS